MQMAVSENLQTPVHADEPRSFISGITARHARTRRRAAELRMDGGQLTTRDAIVNLLNEALASEIACMLRYRRHFYLVSRTGDARLMDELLDRANEEQRHADLIAERIVQLGGEPDLSPMGNCDRLCGYAEDSNLADMAREELMAERLAIQAYEDFLQMLGRSDIVTRRLLEEILAEERVHAAELSARFGGLRQHAATGGQQQP
jgi:bacterioferritin